MMDEKVGLLQGTDFEAYHHIAPTNQRETKRRTSSVLRRLSVLIGFAFVLLTLSRCFSSHLTLDPLTRVKPADAKVDRLLKNDTKVALEAHVMSKCPDAKDCLQMLVVPAMEQISDKVDFQLSFIGSIDANSDAVSCMHGPGECLGNMILLCAALIYPDPKLHLGFANCMISDYRDIPERDLVEECAMEHGLDFSKINDCISDEGEGVGLLRDSIERSQDMNVTKSCTVRLDNKIRCIRDAGIWKDCKAGSSIQDLVADVKKLYEKANE